jgi:hypothetical protein
MNTMTVKDKFPKLKNIHRIDNEVNHTHAWLVLVQRYDQRMVKMFSDGVYGGKRKALALAKAFLADALAQTATYDYYQKLRTKVRCNNTSGIAGVGRYTVISNPDTGHRAVFWLAAWHDEHGVHRTRKFAVSKYGEQKARQLAIAERRNRLAEVCLAKAG